MAYVSAIDQIVLKMKLPAGHFFDVVFVDGRYRACCAMYVVLLGYAVHGRSIVMIDDYGTRRDSYGVVEKYLDLVGGGVDKTRDTAAFKVKKDIDWGALRADVKKYIEIPL